MTGNHKLSGMAPYYRNNETGIIQAHPQSGLGDVFNSVEIAEDGKPIKPHTSLAPSADELRSAKQLLRGGKPKKAEQTTVESDGVQSEMKD